MTACVSVCVPAFRAEHTLAETMASVIAQTWQDWEMVVVVDGGDHATADVARSFADPRVRVVLNDEEAGMVGNFNRAVYEATGDLVKVLCADDLLTPDCLAEQVAVLERYPDVVLTAARRNMVDRHSRLVRFDRGIPGRLAGPLDGVEAVRRVVGTGYNPLGEPASVLFRRDAQRAAGAFSARYMVPMDLEMWIRILRHGGFYGDVRTLAAFRIHPGSVSTSLLSASGRQDRALLRELADDSYWRVGRMLLWNGLVRSVGNDWHRRYRIRRINRQSARAGSAPATATKGPEIPGGAPVVPQAASRPSSMPSSS